MDKLYCSLVTHYKGSEDMREVRINIKYKDKIFSITTMTPNIEGLPIDSTRLSNMLQNRFMTFFVNQSNPSDINFDNSQSKAKGTSNSFIMDQQLKANIWEEKLKNVNNIFTELIERISSALINNNNVIINIPPELSLLDVRNVLEYRRFIFNIDYEQLKNTYPEYSL